MRYDVEVSGFPSSHTGHIVLLGLQQEDYPGTKRIEDWPSWGVPVLRWGKSQGAVTGFAHSGWGLALKKEALPSDELPPFDGIGANEYVVSVTQNARRLHLHRRHALRLGAEHLVSHPERRLPHPDQRRDRLPVHLRRARGPGPQLCPAGRGPARLRRLDRGHPRRAQLCLRRQEPSARLQGRRRRHGRGRKPGGPAAAGNGSGDRAGGGAAAGQAG